MKTIVRACIAGLVLTMVEVPLAKASIELEKIKNMQVEVRDGAGDFLATLRPIFAELVDLGASGEDIAMLQKTLRELEQMTDEELQAVLGALNAAMNNDGVETANENLRAALSGQAKVLETLQTIFERLRVRQLELSVASKAEELRRRQSENQHRTQLLDKNSGDSVVSEAEQRAIEEEINKFVSGLETMEDSAVDKETLEKMKALAAEATEALSQGEYAKAARAQKQLEEMLADLAASSGQEQSSKEFVANLLVQIKALHKRQGALIEAESELAQIYAEQNRLAIDTKQVRIPVENVNAPAAFQLASAAEAMRAALVALSAEPVGAYKNEQSTALRHLARVIEILSQQLESLNEKAVGPESAGPEAAGPEAVGPESAGPESAGPESAGPESAGPESAGSESAGSESAGSESAGSESAGSESAGSESAGSESAGSESAGSESAGSESAGSESAGSESAGSESAGSESAGSESAGSESAGSESAGSESAGSSQSDLEALAATYKKTSKLEQQLASGRSSAAAAAAQEAARLQSDVMGQSPEAGRNLGRAATRLAESLAPDLSAAERAQMRAAAQQNLAQAKAAIMKDGKMIYSQTSGDGFGSSPVPEIAGIGTDLLGRPQMSAAKRAAIEDARREPVSPMYAPLVESYFDALSRSSGDAGR